MKTTCTLFSIFAFLFSFVSQATVRTVSNDPNNPAQYASIPAAITAANPGDTIYVEPTTVIIQNGTVQNAGTNYGNITINKRIVLIGSGFNPAKDNAYISTLSGITFDTVAVVGNINGASGSVVSGFYIYGGISTSNNYSASIRANNITIERCWITSSVFINNINGCIVQQNVLQTTLYGGNNTNTVIRNNIINSETYLAYYGLSTNLIISNNNFIGGPVSLNGAAYTAFNTNTINAVITNNIFYGVDPTGASNCTFNNNITFADANPTIPYGTNTGSGNLSNTNPNFTNFPVSSQYYNPTYNFVLQAGSPGKNAGTDGTDIGIYGGIGFFPSGAPNVPFIEHFNIANSYISPGQSLNVTIEAKAQK